MWVLLPNCGWPMHLTSPVSVQQLLRDGARLISDADVPAALEAAENAQPGPAGPELLTSVDLARVDARAANAQQMARNVRADLTADLSTVDGRVGAIQQAQTDLAALAARLGAAIPAADAVHAQLTQADIDLGKRIDSLPAPGTTVYRARGSKSLASLLGIGAQTTINCPFSNGTPPAGYDPQITITGGPGAVVSFTQQTASNSIDVVVQATAALSLGTVLTVAVQAT